MSKMVLSILACAVCVLFACAGASGQVIVYYQVVYSDGDVRDLTNPPTVAQGIDRVIRIARFSGDGPEYDVWSTIEGEEGLAIVNTGLTDDTQMSWNGTAWVAPETPDAIPATSKFPPGHGRTGQESQSPRVSKLPPPGAGSDASLATVLAGQRRRVEAICSALDKRLIDADHAAAQAQRQYARVKGTDAQEAAAADLKRALARQESAARNAQKYQDQLASMTAAQKSPEFLRASGTIENVAAPAPQTRPASTTRGTNPPGKGRQATTQPAMGIDSPIVDRVMPAHRVQVWELPTGKGERTYTLSMAHAEAGQGGAFYYVAYGDSDGDGKCDKLLARSPLAKADRPGDWTKWSFKTDHRRVWAGNAWVNAGTVIYSRPASKAKRMLELSADVWVSNCFGAAPRWKWGAYVTNFRIGR